MIVRFRSGQKYQQGFITKPYPGELSIGTALPICEGDRIVWRVVKAVGREGFTMTVDVR